MDKNIRDGAHRIIAPNPWPDLAARWLQSFFRRGTLKKHYACVGRLFRLWNERNPRYATLKEFLADIQADGELDRLNEFLLALSARCGCPAVEVYRQFLELLLDSLPLNPHLERAGSALRDTEKLLRFLEKRREAEPGSGPGDEVVEEMWKWLDIRPGIPPGIIF